MKDPNEGLTPEGFIKTGVRRDRIAPVFEPVIKAAVRDIQRAGNAIRPGDVSLYLYGSVATGAAIAPLSDVDLLTIGIPLEIAAGIAHTLSIRFRDICRGVEIAAAGYGDFQGETDEAYGGRVFLRHYCLHLYGREVVCPEKSFAGDIKSARGFNGDIERHYKKWCIQITRVPPEQLGRQIARKSLLAIAGLVSIHDGCWTTDRAGSALRWVYLKPQWRPALDRLVSWSESTKAASTHEIIDILSPAGIVSAIVDDFRTNIGLWSEER